MTMEEVLLEFTHITILSSLFVDNYSIIIITTILILDIIGITAIYIFFYVAQVTTRKSSNACVGDNLSIL